VDRNVSARQTALNRCITMDSLCIGHVVSRGSKVARVRRLPIPRRNSNPVEHKGPMVSNATGWKRCVCVSALYLDCFLAAAVSAALAA